MGSSDEWSEFQEIIDSTPELDMCVDPRVYGGGNRYNCAVAALHAQHISTVSSESPVSPGFLETRKNFLQHVFRS